MKFIVSLFFLGLTVTSSFAQTTDELSQAQQQLEKAKTAYQAAQQQYESARAAKIKAENEIEKAGMDMRQANIAVANETKKAQPIQDLKYKLVANPIFEEMSKGMHYGYSVFMPNVETSGLFSFLSKNVDNEFKSYMKNYKFDKSKRQKGELFFDNIIIPNVSATAIDLYADFVEQDNGVTMRTYFNLGSEFLNFGQEENTQVDNAKNIINHFAKYVYKSGLEESLERAEKQVEADYKALENEKQTIVKAKEDIQQLEEDIAASRQAINEHYQSLDAAKAKIEQLRQRLANVEE